MADVIREFLVALGFHVDDASWKRYQEGLARATRETAKLGSVAVASATALEIAVEKVALHFQDLYYAAQRTNSSVAGLTALDYAAGQVGLSADVTRASIESLARALRLNPGTESFVNSLGVQTRDANGQLRDTTKIFDDLVEHWKSMGAPGTMGFAVAARQAAMLGIDDETLVQLEKNYAVWRATQEDYKRRLAEAGVDADKLGDSSKQLGRDLGRLDGDFQIVGMEIEKDFVEPADAAIKAAADLVEWFTRLDRATNGVASGFLGIGSALIGGGAAVYLLRKIAVKLGIISAGKAAAAAGGEAAAADASILAGAPLVAPAFEAAAGGAAGIGALAGTGLGFGALAGAAGEAWAVQSMNEDLPPGYAWDPEGGLTYVGAAAAAPSVARAANLTRRFESGGNYSEGYGGVDLSGAEHDRFGFPVWAGKKGPEGISHAAGAYQFEPATWDRYAAKLGISDFSPASQDAVFRAVYAAEGMRPWASDQPLMRAVLSEPGAGRGAGGDRPIEMTQNNRTDIRVDGSGDPTAVGLRVAQLQGRVNGDLTRNFMANVK